MVLGVCDKNGTKKIGGKKEEWRIQTKFSENNSTQKSQQNLIKEKKWTDKNGTNTAWNSFVYC